MQLASGTKEASVFDDETGFAFRVHRAAKDLEHFRGDHGDMIEAAVDSAPPLRDREKKSVLVLTAFRELPTLIDSR